MSLAFIDHRTIQSSALSDDPGERIEELTSDNTIGLLTGYQEFRGDVNFQVRRLRRAILAFEEEVGDDSLELAIVENPDVPDQPVLALVPEGGGNQAILLAPCIPPKSDSLENCQTGHDELVQEGM